MDLRQLEIFRAVVSAQLFVQQPAISRKIGLLEAERGQLLLLRAGKRTVVTPAGRILEQQARLIFRQIHIARMEVSDSGILTLRLVPGIRRESGCRRRN